LPDKSIKALGGNLDAQRRHELKQGFSNLLCNIGCLGGPASQILVPGENHRSAGVADVAARANRVIVAAGFLESKLRWNHAVLGSAAFRAPTAVCDAISER